LLLIELRNKISREASRERERGTDGNKINLMIMTERDCGILPEAEGWDR
jgi:hypothetical protein